MFLRHFRWPKALIARGNPQGRRNASKEVCHQEGVLRLLIPQQINMRGTMRFSSCKPALIAVLLGVGLNAAWARDTLTITIPRA